jgi:hypothetical protein
MSSNYAAVLVERLERGSCTGKRIHFSMRQAHNVALLMTAKTGEELRPYQCPFCCLFHVGHRKSLKRLQTEKLIKRKAS